MSQYSFTGRVSFRTESMPAKYEITLDAAIEGHERILVKDATPEQQALLNSPKAIKGEIEFNDSGFTLLSLSEKCVLKKAFNGVVKGILECRPEIYSIEFSSPIDGVTGGGTISGVFPEAEEDLLISCAYSGAAFNGECEIVKKNGVKKAVILSIRP